MNIVAIAIKIAEDIEERNTLESVYDSSEDPKKSKFWKNESEPTQRDFVKIINSIESLSSTTKALVIMSKLLEDMGDMTGSNHVMKFAEKYSVHESYMKE